eukprot:scaffold373651_cov21-Prasinocladus_malaysianus.AAC.1
MMTSEDIGMDVIRNIDDGCVDGWFSLNVPSGLTLYWITNNVLTTAQSVGAFSFVMRTICCLRCRLVDEMNHQTRRAFASVIPCGWLRSLKPT